VWREVHAHWPFKQRAKHGILSRRAAGDQEVNWNFQHSSTGRYVCGCNQAATPIRHVARHNVDKLDA
jgi:hypothetical protein